MSLDEQVILSPVQLKQAGNLGFNWLMDSGIQERSSSRNYEGGVYAWFDLRDETMPFVYSEITGYAINAFLFTGECLKDPGGFPAAQQAADWLLSHRVGGLPLVRTRLRHRDFKAHYFENWLFTFDQWIIVYGLAELYRIGQKKIYLQEALKIADFLIAKTCRQDGTFEPVFNLETEQTESRSDKWSRQPGSFHAKALMALEALSHCSGQRKYREHAERLALGTLKWQQDDGRFITQDSDESTHLHPHLYTLEGLLSFGLSSGNSRWCEAAAKGWQWIDKNKNADGSVYAFYAKDHFLPFTRADVLAQTLRVGATLQQHGILDGIDDTLSALSRKLMEYQITKGLQQGGFLYGQEENGTVHYHVNAWVTMFASQALWIYSGAAKPYDMSLFI